MLMPHRCPEGELSIDEAGNDDPKNRECSARDIPTEASESTPDRRKSERNNDKQSEECLRETGMKNPNLILQECDPQSAENALQDDRP